MTWRVDTTCECGAECVVEYDSDHLTQWVREVWRTCECNPVRLAVSVATTRLNVSMRELV